MRRLWLRVIEKFAAFLASRGRKDLRVLRNGVTLFVRYYPLLVGRGVRQRWPNVLLHNILHRFRDEMSHNHGRWVMSIILHGGYTEVREFGEVVRRPGSVALLRPDEWHNVKDTQPDTWTMFVVGPQFRDAHFLATKTGGVLTRTKADELDKGGLAGYHQETPELLARVDKRLRAMKRKVERDKKLGRE
jgi:hypothetical protein